MTQHESWVDKQIREATERGEFDNLPGAGKPLKLTDAHDPDWWIKGLVEREKIIGVLPPALTLRKEAAAMETELDKERSETDARRILEDFNARVIQARRQLMGGPPVVTPTFDVEEAVEAWRERRRKR